MSIFLCRAVITSAILHQAPTKTGMQSETEMFEAKGAELSRQARRQRIASLTAPVTSALTGILEHLTRPAREAQERNNLLDQLENMPAYMLEDIGVTQDQTGRFFYYNDFGKRVELAPAGHETPATAPEVWIKAHQPAFAA
jgi:hypothetical protein